MVRYPSMTLKTQKSKEAEVELYEELFRSIWARIVPTLGVLNVRAMLEHALAEALPGHPILKEIKVREDGVRLMVLREAVKAGELNHDEVCAALREYLATLIHVLARLTGEVVSRQVKELVQQTQHKNKIKEPLL